jgi:hypothetical protein
VNEPLPKYHVSKDEIDSESVTSTINVKLACGCVGTQHSDDPIFSDITPNFKPEIQDSWNE